MCRVLVDNSPRLTSVFQYVRCSLHWSSIEAVHDRGQYIEVDAVCLKLIVGSLAHA